MILLQVGQQVLFKRSKNAPVEPAWIATMHDDNIVDLYTLNGAIFKVSIGGGIGQWRNPGHWVPESDEEFDYLTDSPYESKSETFTAPNNSGIGEGF